MKFTKRALALGLATILAVTSIIPASKVQAATTPSTVVVNVDKTYQNIRGFGGMNHPEWIGDLTDAQRQKAFGNGTDELGLSVLRIWVNENSSAWSRAVATAKYAQQKGATVFATPWNPPASIREAGGGGFQTGLYHVPAANYAAYAKHLNDFNTYMKSQGVDLYAISIQNEPDYSKEWTGWTSDETTAFLANYGGSLNFRVISPETFQYVNKDYYTKILNNSKAMENTDIFATHFYGTQRSQMDFPALESSGKEIWMTEVYVPNSDSDSADRWPEALQVSENIHNGLVVGNMSVYTWWYIRRSYGLIKENGNISKRGYCMAQYSKFVRPGYVRIDATEQPTSDVYVSAYKGDGDKVVIVAINKGSEGYAQNFKIDGQKIQNVDRYRTSETENLAESKNMAASEDNFFAQLPANSVSTFIVTLDTNQGSSTGGGTGSGNTESTATLLNTYGNLFGYSGTCINLSELKNNSYLTFLKKHYNSITLENEMKPDAVLGTWNKQLISVNEAKALGYYIPSNYTDSTVPKLNFGTIDEVMKICAENGLKMRAHTLVWHSQTPTFFFRSGYDANGSYVSKSVMDARMEFYIRTVMNHVYDSPYADVVYAWDVVNEYLNARTKDKSDWVQVYGEQGTSPDFVRKAFTIADDVLKQRNLRNRVSLFYNDFNTYMNQDDVVSLINYINANGKVCNGVGMQSHLGTDFPSAAYYKSALQKFANAGLEIQITELDVANLKNYDQPQYYYDIASAILSVKKAGGNITGFTLWGMWDSLSWITKMEGKENTTPLLFTGIDQPKSDFYKVIQAYTDAGYVIAGGSGSTGSDTPIDTTGYTALDLGTATAGTYNASAKTLTITDALQTRINLPGTLKEGQTIKVVMNVTYSGTGGFRAWTADGASNCNSNVFTNADADLSKDVEVTFTASADCDYLVFKGPDYQTNIDKLVVNSVKVKYAESSNVTLNKSYSEYQGKLINNPLVTYKFMADPTCVVYKDRVYVYGTAERIKFDSNGTVTENKFETASIAVISSSDLVNWQDEGEINVGSITGWAANSWAPSITSKEIDGVTHFYLYFANGGNGIGVLTATSPLGPWSDPLKKALITRATPNCSDVTWMFDPGVFVDEDGTGYLAFGGGVPNDKDEASVANPKTARIVQLGSDMISLVGNPQTLDPPYLFEDSELNKINGKYVYSYCRNWSTNGGASIGYMTSSKPLGGYAYQGVIVENPGKVFGLYSNNHHHMFEFKGSWYLLYHTMYLEKQMYGSSQGYRSLNIDKVNIGSDGKISSTMTYAGVNAVATLNPYNDINATTMAWNGGIETVYDSGRKAMVVDNAATGDWIGLSNVAFGETGADKILIDVSTTKACTISVLLDAASTAKGGTKVASVQISSGSADYRTIVTALNTTVKGTHDLYFVFEGTGVDVASWRFNQKGGSQQGTETDGKYLHNFTTSGKTSSVYDITGNLSTDKGTVSYDGLTLTQCLKMESGTTIEFTAPSKGTLVLVTDTPNKKIKVQGNAVSTDASGIAKVSVDAGKVTITKGDVMNLFLMNFTAAGGSDVPVVTPHAHSYTAVVTKEATCITTGIKTYTCSCGASYTEEIAMTNHVYSDSFTVDKAPTESEAGSKSRHCTTAGCTSKIQVTTIAPTHTHSYVPTVTKAVTCIATGVKTYACSCGASYTEEIAMTDHVYAAGFTVDKEATATAAGSKSRHCTTTGCTAKTEVTAIAPTGSTSSSSVSAVFDASSLTGENSAEITSGTLYGDGHIKAEGTIVFKNRKDGNGNYTTEVISVELANGDKDALVFKVDGTADVTIEVSSANNGYGATVALVDANGNVVANTENKSVVTGGSSAKDTLTYKGLASGEYKLISPKDSSNNKGLRVYAMNVEGNLVSYGEAHQHSYVGTVTKKATCMEKGVKTYKCSCGASYDEEIAKTEHAYSDEFTIDRVATAEKAGVKSRHCTTEGCNARTEETEIAFETTSTHTHNYTAKITTAPTCMKSGIKTWTCTCGDSFTEELAKLNHAYAAEFTIDKAATATASGSKSRHCTTDGCTAKTEVTVIPATGSGATEHQHSYANAVTKEPTCIAKGIRTYTCSCGASYTEEIAMTDHNYASAFTVDKEPTKTETGEKSRHCITPGCTARTEITKIPAGGEAVVEPENKEGLVFEKDLGLFLYYENNQWISDKYAFVSYKDERFLVANGVMAANMNGLTIDPQDKSVWYYVAEGRIVREYSGLAMYDNEWFYVVGGKLDTKYSGFVTYDGGKFLVAAGRIVNEAKGLVQDPNNPADWYYVADGQVVNYYTGLAMYDEEWFYVINGRLAEDYTGNVTYNGEQFYVINGMYKPAAR